MKANRGRQECGYATLLYSFCFHSHMILYSSDSQQDNHTGIMTFFSPYSILVSLWDGSTSLFSRLGASAAAAAFAFRAETVLCSSLTFGHYPKPTGRRGKPFRKVLSYDQHCLAEDACWFHSLRHFSTNLWFRVGWNFHLICSELIKLKTLFFFELVQGKVFFFFLFNFYFKVKIPLTNFIFRSFSVHAFLWWAYLHSKIISFWKFKTC